MGFVEKIAVFFALCLKVVDMSNSEAETQPKTAPNVRTRNDAAWDHAIKLVHETGKQSIQCTYCQKSFAGGGIFRFKQHLMGVKGEVAICRKVPPDVRDKLISIQAEKKSKEKARNYDNLDYEEVTRPQPPLPKKRGIDAGTQKLFKYGVNDHVQPSIKASLQSKERKHEADKAIAMWFYKAGIPWNAINCPLFQVALNKAISIGHGYTHPTYHALRVSLLDDAKKSVELIVDGYRQSWKDTGCTIMADGWTDNRQRSFINFLVYCPKGVSFVKSVDASGFASDSKTLCNLFSEVIEWVGVENVIQVVTDNAANYKATGNLVTEKYQSIYWTPCAAHCINLIMKDICEMPMLKATATSGSKITIFVYNHKWTLNWLRNRPNWKEIIRPAPTRFATTFIALQSLYEHKEDLEALVVCPDFKKFLKVSKGRQVKEIVLDSKFWKNVLIAVRLMAPLMRLLRICDCDEKPSLGYVYDGMRRARKAMKETFRNNKNFYKPYTDTIKARWDGMFRHPLHTLSYMLNPAFRYDEDNFCKKQHISDSMLQFVILQQKIGQIDATKLLLELQHFQERRLSFASELAMQTSKTIRPDEWWKLFGTSAPILQKLAIKFLCQTASSSGCERNWSTFDWIHSKKRNRLEHRRLNDLVYIHYNLRLQDRLRHSEMAFDPIDYESIDKTEFWIIDEESPEGEFGLEELENMLEELPICDCDRDQDIDSLSFPVRDDNVTLQGSNEENDEENEDWLPSYVREQL